MHDEQADHCLNTLFFDAAISRVRAISIAQTVRQAKVRRRRFTNLAAWCAASFPRQVTRRSKMAS
jgi:hypothetical protein